MNHIDVLDDAVNVNVHILRFPLSYEEIRNVLGEACSEPKRTMEIPER